MQLFATYTFGQALLTVLELALLFLWIWLAITVVIDVFRSHDLSGWAKAGWLVLIVLVPLLGVLVYVIARSDKMKAHQGSDQRQQEIASIAELADLKRKRRPPLAPVEHRRGDEDGHRKHGRRARARQGDVRALAEVVHHEHRRVRDPFYPCPFKTSQRIAADRYAWMARLGH